METKIKKTLAQWFPEAFDKSKTYTEYEMLNVFAKYTQALIREDKGTKSEPFKIINLLYVSGNLHDKNAIENEFFSVLMENESEGSLKQHLELMPEVIRKAYIKTIIEN